MTSTAGTARRVGVFGGAFDPPHVAHVALARAALEQLALDELRILPTGQAWHRAGAMTAPAHRLAMARIAFGALRCTVIDERELHRPGPTYTIDTLRELKAEQPEALLFLVMGEDQAVSFTRWHDWQAIPQLATICVAARASTGSARTGQTRAEQNVPAPAENTAHPELVEGLRVQGVLLLSLPSMPESATEVRKRVAAGEGIAHLVPAGVARYIDEHSLYQPA